MATTYVLRAFGSPVIITTIPVVPPPLQYITVIWRARDMKVVWKARS